MDVKLNIVKTALSMIGQRAILGPQNNEKLMSFFNRSGKIVITNDDTPWCSAFLKAVLLEVGLVNFATLAARSWLSVGKEINKPELGDIVIFWRESPQSWKGHVGIYVAENDSNIYVLGGNQANEVNISQFPKKQVLGFRDITGLRSV